MSANIILKDHHMLIGKHTFLIFASLFVIRNFRSVVLKVGGITALGMILRGNGGDKTKGGDEGKTTQKRSTTNRSLR